jgi:hypothetical protein
MRTFFSEVSLSSYSLTDESALDRDQAGARCAQRNGWFPLMDVSEMVRMQGCEASVAGHVNGGGWQPMRGPGWPRVEVG